MIYRFTVLDIHKNTVQSIEQFINRDTLSLLKLTKAIQHRRLKQ